MRLNRNSQLLRHGRARLGRCLPALARALVVAALGSLVLGCTTAPTAPEPVASPPQWHFQGRTSYEERAPGLGHSRKFAGAAGVIDVYVYDLQRPGWRDGVSDPAFSDHFLTTIEEVRHMARRGDYVDLEVGPVRDVDVAGHRFRVVDYRFARQGRRVESLTFLTATNGKLLKYRMSFFAPTGFDIEAHARRFIEDDLKGLPWPHGGSRSACADAPRCPGRTPGAA